jgi:hypothetical protein
MYKVYASRGRRGPRLRGVEPYECAVVRDAARLCVELCSKGYTIHKVSLPTGGVLYAQQIRDALRLGRQSLLTALES